MHDLTGKDYKLLLRYYDQPIPIKKQTLRDNAESIISEKLCRCIKNVKNVKKEKDRIAICRSSVFNKKGIDFVSFSCKNKPHLYARKTAKNTRKQNKKKIFKIKKRMTIKNKGKK